MDYKIKNVQEMKYRIKAIFNNSVFDFKRDANKREKCKWNKILI